MKAPADPPHLLIRASAGSGKTYRLTSRIIELLDSDADPSEIVALTFTRKAAGEFIDSLLQRLAGAGRDPALAARLAGEIQRPGLNSARSLTLLRRVIDRMHRLSCGTLDSFFFQLIQVGAPELGLEGRLTLLDNHAAALEGQRVLGRLFERPRQESQAQQEFLEAFKQATFGRESKSVARQLGWFIEDFQDLYHEAPYPAAWGDPQALWPNGVPGHFRSPPVQKEDISTLRAWVQAEAGQPALRDAWIRFLDFVESWTPGVDWIPSARTLFAHCRTHYADLAAGEASIPYGRSRLDFKAEAAAALLRLLHGIQAGLLKRSLEMTRGIHRVVAVYDAAYEALVRRTGRLTFRDFAPLLTRELHSWDTPGLALRERLMFRLDARYRHWLLDEFQDTSLSQWRVLEPMIDEVLQDTEGQRTFFCVGDPKQAIYGWRGGYCGLFDDLKGRYDPVLREEPLTVSWRSAPPVLEMVNRVLGDPHALSTHSTECSNLWSDGWRDHQPSPQTARLSGLSAWFHLPRKAGADARHMATAQILKAIDPVRLGLTCAVLAPKNDQVAAIVRRLRAETCLPVIEEKEIGAAQDNPLGLALISLLQNAAHPGDALAREHLLMIPSSPLTGYSPDRLSREVLEEFHRHGLASVFESWIRVFSAAADRSSDPFLDSRAADLRTAARQYDALGERNPDRAIAYLRKWSRREHVAPGAVRVMTIHQSKGLGFDVVVLPELEGNGLYARRRGPLVRRSGNRIVRWILEGAGQPLTGLDAEFLLAEQSAREEGWLESLCLLYVGMTRAKRSLYLLTEERAGNSRSMNFPALLELTLGEDGPRSTPGPSERPEGATCAWWSGQADWLHSLSQTPPAPSSPEPERGPPVLSGERWIPKSRLLPSDRSDPATGDTLSPFALPNRAALQRGSRVHAAFAAIEWAGVEAESALDDWLRVQDRDPEAAAAADTVRKCLQSPELRPYFLQSEPGRLIWREQPFEAVIDGHWVTGVFDRVVLDRGPDGMPWRAVVLDFKTNHVRNKEEAVAAAGKYRSQLDLYQRVLGRLTGLEAQAIAGLLIFTAGPYLVSS